MKKIFTLLCAGFLGLTTLQAEVLFECNFNDSTTGRLSAGAWNSGTLASDNKWYTNGNPSAFHQVVEQQLTYPDYHSTATGKAVEVKKSEQKDYILFPSAKQHASILAGEKYYMSFLYKPTELNTSDNAKNGTNTYIAGLLTSASGTGTAYTNAQVMVTTIDANTFKFGIRKITETAQYVKDGDNDKAFNINDTYLVVAEYIVNSGTADDVVNLYINPTKDSQTVSATNNLSGAPTDKTGIVGVGILAIVNAPNAALIDEIKVTTSWDDLWESGGASTDPAETIAVEKAVNFYEEDLYNNFYISTVFPNKEYKKEIEILAENLTEDITVSHKNSDISLSASTIDKEGGKLTITLNPSNISGNQVDTIVYSSGEATDTTFVAWGVNLQSYTDIASLKAAYASDNEYGMYLFSGEAVITRTYSGAAYIQDATAAIRLSNGWDQADAFANLVVGDKIGNFIGYAGEKDAAGIKDFIIGQDVLPISHNNIVEPQIITLAGLQANALDYLLEIVKIENAELDQSNGTFLPASKVSFEQGNNSAFIQAINSSADYIGESIPAKADITGFSINQNGTVIVPRSKADIVSKGISTAIDNINSSSLQGGERGRLFLHNGQIIILRDNKTFNLLGTEIK